jgi:hypothetical protein
MVQEITDLVAETAVPGAGGFAGSVINFRGKVIPLADLRVAFGLESRPVTIDSRIVVIEIGLGGELGPGRPAHRQGQRSHHPGPRRQRGAAQRRHALAARVHPVPGQEERRIHRRSRPPGDLQPAAGRPPAGHVHNPSLTGISGDQHMRFTIKAKLAAGFGTMIVLLVGIAVLGILSLGNMYGEINDVIDGPAKRLENSQQANIRMLEAIRAEKNLILATTPEEMNRHIATGEEARQSLGELVAQGEERASEAGKTDWNSLKTHLESSRTTRSRI